MAGLTKVLEYMDAKAAKMSLIMAGSLPLHKSEDLSTIVTRIQTNAALLSKWVSFPTLSEAACLK